MTWEEHLVALFDDLEQQADSLFHVERVFEVADRAQAEYAAVTLASRLMASVGLPVELRTQGVGAVVGELRRVSVGWCLVAQPRQEWILVLSAVREVRGCSPRSVAESTWSPVTRLGLSSALRGVTEARARCVVHLVDGTHHDVRPERVGADFFEVTEGASTRVLFPLDAIAAVQRRD
ncbi:conserved hypothetical protein [metagenome]|uniref:Uncharacterized protein n=1 Tax=metagenome TaxID=256318 RepID=A0A2P2CG69_9ZZZZ